MNLRRVLLFGGLGLACLLLLAAAAVFNSGVQTWAARRALAGQPDLGLGFERVSAGLDRVRLEQVTVTRPGAFLTLPSVEVDLPVTSAAFSEKFLIRRLVARGWTLDLSRTPVPSSAKAAAAAPKRRAVPRGFSFLPTAYADDAAPAPAVFAGIFDHLRLPVDLALDGVDLAGDVILPVLPGQPGARAKVTITGGGLAAGKPGRFDYTAVVTFSGPEVAVRELTVRGTLGVVMDTPRAITRFVATTAADAAGPKFPQGVKLLIDFSAARSTYGENYAASVSSGAKQLAAIETSYPAGASRLGGNWRLDMRDTDLAAFSFGHDLPTFEAVGEGRFDTDTAFSELRASGRLNATVDRLGVIDAQLSALGLVHVTADFDFSQRAGATRVDRLAVTLEGAHPVASVQALQAFEFNLTGDLSVADPTKELLGVVLQGLPLTWVDPLLARAGYRASGGDLQGELSASARNGGFSLRAKTPLTIAGLSLVQTDGRPLVQAVDLLLDASFDYAPQGWQVAVAPFALRAGGTSVLNIEGRIGRLAGDKQAVKVAGKLTGRLPELLAQPAVLGSSPLTAGDAQGDFAASLGDKQELQFRLALANLAAPAAPGLPAVSVEVRLDRTSDGKFAFNVPMRFECEDRKSDLTVAGTGAPGPAGLTLDARVTSEFLAVEDAQVLAAPFSGPRGAKSAGGAPAATAAPFWAGLNGQVALALKKVVYNGQFQVTNVTGMLQLDAGSFKLVGGSGGFDSNSDLRLDGGLTFRPRLPQPYALNADVALNNFDTVPAFRAIDPAKPPTLEARVNLSSRLTATGATLEDLASRATGDLTVTSKGGIFRGLSADLADRIQKSQSRLTAVASFLGVVADDYVNKAKILSDTAKALSEIPFDQLSLTATPDAEHNLQLKEFSVISPEVRISGEGEIRYVESVPVLAQPLTLQLNLGARGKLGDLIRRTGLLDARQDNLGYSAFAVPLRIRGTLANPDTNEIRTALLNSALERSGLLDSLLGK